MEKAVPIAVPTVKASTRLWASFSLMGLWSFRLKRRLKRSISADRYATRLFKEATTMFLVQMGIAALSAGASIFALWQLSVRAIKEHRAKREHLSERLTRAF